jgi:hypothetical protein
MDTGRQVPAPPAVVQNQAGVSLGENTYAGRRNVIRLPYPDRETMRI